MNLYINTYQAISLLNAPKIHTDVLWDLTILFGGIALVYFTAIFFFRNKISGKSKKTSTLKSVLSPMISEFIFYDETGSKEEKTIYINLKVKIRDMLKDDFKRKTISEILLELRKDVSGVAQERLFDLFQDLDLHKDSYKKLESWRWEYISSGIQELTRMEVHDSYSFLTKFVNDKRATIRKQAEIAVVTLDNQGINYFLDTTRNKISEWQQLKLIEVLSTKTDFVPPSFKAWLVSKNKYVVLFSLRLIKYYDQNDANTSITELVKHRDDQIKQEAIECIKAFHLSSSLPVLQKVFWSCSVDIKIAILDAISILGTDEIIPFLESIANKERNYSVTSKAMGAINAIVPDSILPTEGIADISNTKVPADIIVDTPVQEQQSSIAALPVDQEAAFNTDTPIVTEVAAAHKDPSVVLKPKSDNAPNIEEQVASVASQEDLPIDVNAIEVVFSTAFIPLVTASSHNAHATAQTAEKQLNDIEVSYENAFEKYVPNSNAIDLPDPFDIEVIVDEQFLPLVVPNEAASVKTNYLNELDLVYEIVSSASEIEEKITEKKVEDIIVSYELLEVITLTNEEVLENIEVVFEEVVPEQIEISFEMDDHLREYFDFEIKFNNGQPPLRIPKVETNEIFDIEVNAQEVKPSKLGLSEIEVVSEIEANDATNDEELPSWLLNQISNSAANSYNKEHLKMEGPEWEAKESQMMNQIQDYIKNLPNHDASYEDVAESIQLLDDIELFGDEREIPLLQELMQKEDKAQTKERIDGIMKRFMGSNAYGKGLEGPTNYSVFEELFRNCDTESKLILLDEIILIGDHKEELFLEQLCTDPDQKIRKKAASSLKKLKERFERVASGQESKDANEYERFINMMELDPPKIENEPSYFKIDFDLDSDVRTEMNRELEKKRRTFLISLLIS